MLTILFCCHRWMLQYIPGKHTTAIPRVASAAEFIEPTQGFDSHVSVISPSTNDSLQNQYDRSQVGHRKLIWGQLPTPSCEIDLEIDVGKWC